MRLEVLSFKLSYIVDYCMIYVSFIAVTFMAFYKIHIEYICFAVQKTTEQLRQKCLDIKVCIMNTFYNIHGRFIRQIW